MTGALEESLNTGMVFAMREMGPDTFTKYVHAFGFGEPSGVELDTEVPGDVSSLDIGSEIYAATASFGQGITVTPLQMAAAYAAIANGGILLRPTVVAEIRHPDGAVERSARHEVRRAIEEKTARLVGAMLISVIEHGHGKQAGIRGYYLAGKTGTAQVARSDGRGYLQDASIGSFAGFGPADNPRFVIVARIDHPRDVQWAESTAAPLFGEVAGFLLKYFEIPPTRL
jgi:cell division protein FtsI/penicillin-binding protein 2